MNVEITKITDSNHLKYDDMAHLSLESMITRAVTEISDEQYAQKIGELDRIKNPQNAISPEDLYLYQLRASEYNLTVSLYSALTRKAVNAVDTVVRA